MRPGRVVGVRRQENQTGGIEPRPGQLEIHHRAEELVRDLDHHARAIARVLFPPPGTAVIQPRQGRPPSDHDVVRPTPGDVDHERHPARVMLVARVVKALGSGNGHDASSIVRKWRGDDVGPLRYKLRSQALGARAWTSECR